MHIPVLLEEICEIFSEPLHVFFDGTLGQGGHASVILKKHPELKTYYGFDRDPKALELAKDHLKDFPQVLYEQKNYSELETLAESFDGILLDIGVSSMQLDQSERGFSFLKEGPLDMRMGEDARFDARKVVNTFSEKKLSEIFWVFGEERYSRKAAKIIAHERKKKGIDSTFDLCKVLGKAGFVKRGKIHPATRIFQALRIFVNDELTHLQKGIEQGFDALNVGGKMVVISFHSLEDRLVKHFFRDQALKNGKILLKKPLCASQEEKKCNPRSRSAKLRVIQKISHDKKDAS